MSSTPHFALAQHPETGAWALMEWFSPGESWLTIAPAPWARDRNSAILAVTQHVTTLWVDSEQKEAALATLDRLIEAERNHPGEAQVQTIVKMGGAE